MFKKIISFCFIIALFQGVSANAQSSQKAKALLDQVSKKVKSYDNIVIRFRYIHEDGNDHSRRETKGDVSLKGNKYMLELMGTIRIFDGQKLYDIVPEDEEVNISNYSPEKDDLLSPSRMLRFYEKGFTYKWDITQDVEGRKIQYVKLLPADKKSEIKNILLGIDAQTKHINKLIQIYKDGSKVTIDVKSFKTNQPLSENLFKFNKDKYQGYYINRLD